MRVAGKKEGEGGKGHGVGKDGNSNKGNGNEGGGRAMVTRAMAMMWAMATATRLAGNEEDMGKGRKSNGKGNVRVVGEEEDGGQVVCDGNKEGNGNGDKGGRQATAMGTKRAMATGTWVVGNKEGDGNGSKSDGNGIKGGG
jgi:hypothetical protein